MFGVTLMTHCAILGRFTTVVFFRRSKTHRKTTHLPPWLTSYKHIDSNNPTNAQHPIHNRFTAVFTYYDPMSNMQSPMAQQIQLYLQRHPEHTAKHVFKYFNKGYSRQLELSHYQ